MRRKTKSKKTRPKPSSLDPTTAYAKAVIAGKEIAGPHVRAACRRHLQDLKDGKKRGLYFDKDAAEHVFGFFSKVLKLSEGQFEGKPFVLHGSQAFILGSLFGWKRKDGTRRFRRAYIEQGKGNGKSPLAGGIGLYGMTVDNEPGAQIYAAGARKEQSAILFSDAVKMARQSPALDKRLTPSGQNPVWNLAALQTGSFFRPISRESGRTGSGPRPHFALCDEIHEHPDRHVMDMLERGFKFRRQPLLFMITNSGSDRNSVCWEEHQYAVNVAHGDAIDDTAFSYVCALDEGDDPLTDKTCWKKANPLLGTILTEDYIAGVVAQGLAIPGKLNGILRLHFCVWTDAETAWIGRDAWMACEDKSLNIEDFVGKTCWGGLDLSETKDMTAKSLVFDDGWTEETVGDDGRVIASKPKFVLFAHGYTPRETMLERERADKLDYHVWERAGHITATPGKVVRLDYVASDLGDDKAKYNLELIAYDQHLIKEFVHACGEVGVQLPLIDHGQGIGQRKDTPLWMPESVKQFETLILERRIRIAPNLALRSAVQSATFYTSPAGLKRFDKAKATSRIDLCVSSAMAIGLATSHAKPKPKEFQVMIFGGSARR